MKEQRKTNLFIIQTSKNDFCFFFIKNPFFKSCFISHYFI